MIVLDHIELRLEKVEGFLDVQDKKREIYSQLTEVLAENKDMKVIISKCEEMMQSDVQSEAKKISNNDTDKE